MHKLPMLRTPILCLVAAATSLLSATALVAAPQSRIASIGQLADTPIAHSVSSRARQATDLGPAPPNEELAAITLHFSRSASQQAALNQLLADQQNPASPRYRKWLTPQQFKAQFGMSDADVARVSAWLTARGFTVTTTSLTNTYIVASGTVAQAEKAFSVSLRSVSLNGEQHITNVTDPQLPAAFANVVTGITGLSNILPKPRIVVHKVAKPQFTTTVGGVTQHYISPSDYNTIYDLAPLAASAINGTGVTIAVMGQTAISLTDVAAFRSAAGLSASTPVVSYNPTTLGIASPEDLDEAQLDVEWAGAVAPNATIQYIATSTALNGGGVFGSLLSAIANTSTANLAKILSISYGGCEPEFSDSVIYAYDQYFQQANAQGQTLIAPGGDSGATDCDNNSAVATDGLAVDFPGSSPHATAVGGTMLNSSASYWNASNAAGGSSALSYIPETVWNESAILGGLASGGGGRSIFFSKPSWQIGTGVPADAVRDVPDLALDAGVEEGYLICANGSCTNGFADAAGDYNVIGGTSAGVPSFAGILALVEQKIAQTGGLGNINPTLYGLAATSANTVFHDIVSGTNASSCDVGSPDCSSSTLLAGYSATTGYDLASGWGSVDGNNLANLWASAVPTPSIITTGSTPSVTSVSLASGAACGITGTVNLTIGLAASTQTTPLYPTASTTIPTGTVQLFVDGAIVSGSAATLSNGAATLTLNTSTLSSGSHTIAVAYSGDSVFASSRGNLAPSLSPSADSVYVAPSTIDVVSATAPDFSLTPCLPTLVVAAGSSGTVTVTAAALNGFSGPVSFSASADSSLAASAGLSVNSVTISANSPGSSVFTLNAFYKTTSNVRQASSHAPVGGGSNGMSRREIYGTGAGTAALASVLFLILPRRRRYISLLALVVSVAAIGSLGCGSGATTIPASTVPPTTGTTNTPAGSYIVYVTASGTNSAGTALAHTVSLTVTVQ